MEVNEAVKQAEGNGDVREHMKNGFYLTSAMAIPEQLTSIDHWTLIYFHPEDRQVFSVEVTKGNVKKGNPADPLVQDHYTELDYAGALDTKALLAKIIEVLAKEREFPTKAIITLRDSEWKVAVVAKSLNLLRVDLDMKTGEIKRIENSSLITTV